MACQYCSNGERDTGIVFANSKASLNMGVYAFLCPCEVGKIRGKAYPVWSEFKYRRGLIPEYEDQKPTARWILQMVEQNQQKTDAFKIRMERWGRDHFERIWKQHEEETKKRKADLKGQEREPAPSEY